MVGHEKSLFSGILIGPKSLFRFTLIACHFEIYAAHRRSLLQRAAPEDAVRSAAHVESSDTMCSRKGQCQASPEYSETGDTHHSREGILRWREIRAAKRIQPAYQCTTHHHDRYHPHDIKQYNYWVELVRVCRLDVLAAAAACWFYCDHENPPLPNELSEGSGVAQFLPSYQLGGKQGGTCIFFGRVDGAYDE